MSNTSITSVARGEAAKRGTKKKRSVAFRVVRALFIATLVPIALLGAAFLYFNTSDGKARVRAFLIAKLAPKVDGTVEIGELDYALGGSIHIGAVSLKDRSGDAGVVLDSLTITPSWKDLLHGRIVVSKIALTGLHLHVVKLADGTSNLEHYLHFEKPEPADKRITVDAIELSNVSVIVDQPDGTRLSITDFALAGKLSAIPKAKDADIELSPISLEVHVDKPGGALSLAVLGLRTGVTAHLEGGLGTLTLHPTSATVVINQNGQPEKKLDVGLGASTFDIGKGAYGASVESLLAGALSATSIQIHAATDGDKVAGAQQADVIGLHLDAARANALLGKELLASNVDVDVHVSGPPDKIALDASVKTDGGNVGLKGTVGVADPSKPVYDLTLTLDDVASERLLAKAIPAPPASVKKVTLHLAGSGKTLDTIKADATLHVETIVAKAIPIDDIALDGHIEDGKITLRGLDISALEQKVHASGSVDVPKKRVNLTVSVEGDPGRAIELLKKAGLTVDAKLPKGLLVLRPGDLTLGVSGELDGNLAVTVASPGLALAGGKVGLDVKATVKKLDPPVDGKAVDVKDFDAHVTLEGVQIPSVLALRGKSLPGMNAWANGTIDAMGTPSDPQANLNLDVTAVRADHGGSPIGIHVGGSVDKTHASLSVRGRRGDAALFDVDARVPLALQGEPKGVDSGAPFSLRANLPETSFDDLINLLPPEIFDARLKTKIPLGSVAANVDLGGSLERPTGSFDVDVKTERIALPTLPVVPAHRVHLTGTLAQDGKATRIDAKADGWLDTGMAPLLTLTAGAVVQGSPLVPGPKAATWNADLEVPTISIATLPVSDKKVTDLGGTLALSARLHGTADDALGTIRVDAHDLMPNGGGPVDVGIGVDLNDDQTVVTGDADLAKALLLRIDGKVGVAGRGLLARARAHAPLDPTLAVTVDVPSRPVASLATLRPPLANVPGNLAAHIEVTGIASEPLAKGNVGLDGFTAVNGEPGKVAVALDAGHDMLSATIGVGTGAVPPIQIEAHAPREGVKALGTGGTLPIAASVRASKVDLRTLLPTFALDKVHGLGVRGALDWNMDFSGTLKKEEAGLKLGTPTLTGDLDLEKGEIDIPGTKRTYKDVTVRLSALPEGLHIDQIGATESDLEITHRWIAISGDLAWHDLAPTRVDLDIRAGKWLLFGTKTIGLADAPRGSLTIDAHASSSLDGPIKKANVEVRELEALFPDRFDKSHQPEDVHVGDVLFVGDASPGGKVVEAGKLPIPAGVIEEAERAKKLSEESGSGEETGLDVDIQIDPGARLQQAPIELMPAGTIHIASRPSGRKIRGALSMKGGLLSLGGAEHPLAEGTLTFDDIHPAGWLDVGFKRRARNSALREIADEKAGDDITIHMFGPLSDRRTVLGGAGSPGALFDLLAMHNEGRERFYTEPDLPISSTVEYPQHEGLLVLSFISVNLPHLLFIDRVDGWANPYDSFDGYGRIQHYEAQRFSNDGHVRVLATERPTTVGTSEDEVELDYCFTNTARSLFGVGALAGSRGGGGADVFFEWSTKN